MADQVSTNTSIQDIPAWMKNFMSTADPNQAGILDEAMRQYQARSGNLSDQQLADLQMPNREIAARTPLQTQATALAQGGVGSYLPMLQAGAASVGSGVTGVTSGIQTMQEGYNPLAAAQQMVTDSTTGALPYRDFAINQMQNSIPEVQAAAQAGIDVSALGRQGVLTASQQGQNALNSAGRRGELAAAGGVSGIIGATDMGVQAGQQTAQNILGQVGAGQSALTGSASDLQNLGSYAQQASIGAGQDITNLAQKAEGVGLGALQALPEYGQRMESQGQQTSQNLLTAGSSANELGQFGLSAAQAGMQGLEGSAAQWSPGSVSRFMNPYEQSVIDAAMADVARAGQQSKNQLGATAVGAGAFGGSRQGIQGAEISRNVLDQQAKTAAGMRQQGYESASARAQGSYEAAKARQQNSASLMGQLGQAGAGTGLNATQIGMTAAGQAGQAAMQGTQAGANTAAQATQLGLAGLGQAASDRARAGQLSLQGTQQGMTAANQAGNMGAQSAQMGMGAAQQAGAAQMQGAQMGMQGAQSAGQMGLAGAQAAGSMGAQGAQMGMQGASQGAGLGMQGAQMGMSAAGQTAQLGGQVGSMGQSYGQMGLAGAGQMGAISGQYGALGSGMANASQGLGSLGMQQAQLGEAQQGLNLNDMNTLNSIGAQEQAQQQSELGAQYQNQYQQYQQPMQELGFYSDIYQGMPIGQSTYSQGSAPGPSALSQVGGLATGLYGMYRATQ